MKIYKFVYLPTIVSLMLYFTTPLHAASLSKGADDDVQIGVCHNILYEGKGKLIFISPNALDGHLGHGDTTRFQVLGDGLTCKKVEEEKRPSSEQSPKR